MPRACCWTGRQAIRRNGGSEQNRQQSPLGLVPCWKGRPLIGQVHTSQVDNSPKLLYPIHSIGVHFITAKLQGCSVMPTPFSWNRPSELCSAGFTARPRAPLQCWHVYSRPEQTVNLFASFHLSCRDSPTPLMSLRRGLAENAWILESCAIFRHRPCHFNQKGVI